MLVNSNRRKGLCSWTYRRDDHKNAGRLVGFRIQRCPDTSKDSKPGRLPDRTEEKGPATTVLLDDVQAVESEDYVHLFESVLVIALVGDVLFASPVAGTVEAPETAERGWNGSDKTYSSENQLIRIC